MKTPFEILNIAVDSDDDAIRKAYLGMVRQFPPERFPEEFQRVRTAYESIKTARDRLRYELFDYSMPDMHELAADIKAKAKPGRPTEKQLRQLLDQAVNAEITALVVNNG